MKTLRILIFAIAVGTVLTGSGNVYADGIYFEKSSWSEVKRKAQRENKLIFVDFYASWCGPCIWMARNTFTDASVGEYLNQHYVSYKVDAENEEQALVASIDLEAYPTLVFFDASGKILLKEVGAQDAEEFLATATRVSQLKKLGNTSYRDMTEDQKMAYLEMLYREDPSKALSIVEPLIERINRYNYDDTFNWFLISHFVWEECHVLDYIAQGASTLYDEKENFLDYISALDDSLFYSVVEEEDLNGLKRFQDYDYKLISSLGADYDKTYYDQRSLIRYYLLQDDYSEYISQLTTWIRDYHYNNSEKLAEFAISVAEDYYDTDYINGVATTWALRARELEDNWYTTYACAYVHYMGDENRTALSYAKALLDYEDLDDGDIELIHEFIGMIEAEIL